MSPALTRRRLARVGAAPIGTAVAGISAAAKASAPDAALMALIARHGAAVAERNAHTSEHDAAERRFTAAAPACPEALTETFSDILDRLPSTGLDKHPDGRPWHYFTPGDVERLRAAGPGATVIWSTDGRPMPTGQNPRGEARRLEILAAYDAWQGEKQALSDRVGLTAAEAEDDRLYEAVWSLRDAIRDTSPATLAGLCAKAKWALTLDDREDENEQVVRDLAAFGQARS